jgi:hypothetical protein
MEPGESWYQDVSYPHRVANRGTEARIHLVLDCEINAFLRDLFGVDMAVDKRRHNADYRRRLRRIAIKDYGRMLLYDRNLLRRKIASACTAAARKVARISWLLLFEPHTLKRRLWQRFQ